MIELFKRGKKRCILCGINLGENIAHQTKYCERCRSIVKKSKRMEYNRSSLAKINRKKRELRKKDSNAGEKIQNLKNIPYKKNYVRLTKPSSFDFYWRRKASWSKQTYRERTENGFALSKKILDELDSTEANEEKYL